MKTEITTITPEKAAELLKLNTSNRRYRPHLARVYAAAITAGDWRLNHQGIAISKNNVILDGQHRLHAIIMAGIAIQTNLSTDVDDEAYASMDIGLNRSTSDRFNLPRAVAYALNFATKIGFNNLSESSIRSVQTDLGAELEMLNSACKRTDGVFASSGFRAGLAFLLKTLNPDQKEIVLNRWKSLVNNRTSEFDCETQHSLNHKTVKRIGFKVTLAATDTRLCAYAAYTFLDTKRSNMKSENMKFHAEKVNEFIAILREFLNHE